MKIQDVMESFIRSSGPGGQNVNKVATCVQLIHKPTGLIVKCAQFRSQAQNRAMAWQLLAQALADRAEKIKLKARHDRELVRRQKRRRSKASKERMLETKRRRGTIKVMRGRVGDKD